MQALSFIHLAHMVGCVGSFIQHVFLEHLIDEKHWVRHHIYIDGEKDSACPNGLNHLQYHKSNSRLSETWFLNKYLCQFLQGMRLLRSLGNPLFDSTSSRTFILCARPSCVSVLLKQRRKQVKVLQTPELRQSQPATDFLTCFHFQRAISSVRTVLYF